MKIYNILFLICFVVSNNYLLSSEVFEEALKNAFLTIGLIKLYGANCLLDKTKAELFENINRLEKMAVEDAITTIYCGRDEKGKDILSYQVESKIRDEKLFLKYYYLLKENIEFLKQISPAFVTKLHFLERLKKVK